MALTDRSVLRSDVRPDEKLASVAIPVLCGLACLFVAWAFAYLDRRIGRFAVEAVVWTVWVGLGYFLAAANLNGDGVRAARLAKIFTIVACVLAVVPGVLMFTLLRWAAFALLMVTAARAPAMRTRRDFYYALAAIVAVSLLVATHGNADWTTWFYLGPAFLCIALALAWDYAAGVELGRLRKTGLTLGFLAVCMAVSVAVFAIVPRPNILGFGFLPPGTDTPGRFKVDAPRSGDSGDRSDRGAGGESGGGAGSSGAAQPSLLEQAVTRMQQTLKEPSLPQWQRGIVAGMLGMAETYMWVRGDLVLRRVSSMTPSEREEARQIAQRVASVLAVLKALLALLLLALLAWGLWLLRWRLAVAGALWSAWLLARWKPAVSMRCSALAVRWMLGRRGHPMRAGQSVLEHLGSAPALPALARHWLGTSLRLYSEHRFGGVGASPHAAVYMRRAIESSVEIMR